MLRLKIRSEELYLEKHNEFITIPETVVYLEHSLRSISEWESKWNKPFLVNDEKTNTEKIDYIRCMVEGHIEPLIFTTMINQHLDTITKYIEKPMSATVFSDDQVKRSSLGPVITSEIIYYYMTVLNIPFECDRWNINRLLTLIRVCSIKNGPQKRMSKQEIMRRNRELNEKRLREMGMKG